MLRPTKAVLQMHSTHCVSMTPQTCAQLSMHSYSAALSATGLLSDSPEHARGITQTDCNPAEGGPPDVSMTTLSLCTAQHTQPTPAAPAAPAGFTLTAQGPQCQVIMQGGNANRTHLAKGLFDDHPEEALALVTLKAGVVNALADLHRPTTVSHFTSWVTLPNQ